MGFFDNLFGQKTKVSFKEEEKREPRDFLQVASSTLETPKPLAELVKENKDFVVEKLLEFVQSGDIYERKHAAFALGQIGDENALEPLRECYASESVAGTRAAIGAAIIALSDAPSNKGYNDLDRRNIIEKEYNKS